MSTASSTKEHPVTRWLRNSHSIWFTIFTSVVAFSLYTSVYAFRKTFAAATFDNLSYLHIDYKVWLVIFQVLGYGLSKFIGIKIIAELQSKSRAIGILLMSATAALSWLLFAIVPAPYNIIFLFTNGFPLGMVWGMVFGYLEGRRMTEVLGAALSVSFIFSSGLCRSTGAYIMQNFSVNQFWMPFVACCLFALPLLLFLWLLDKVPPPSPLDESLRTKREPMNGTVRQHFLKTFLPGIILFVIAYVLMTTFRDFRDNFSADVWKAAGYQNSPEIFTSTEIPISIVILILMGSIMIIKNNHLALMINHVMIVLGMILIGISSFCFDNQFIDAKTWMILIGLGLYMGYVPFNSIFFDRLIATFKYTGTVGFIMYVADSFGYLGNIIVLFIKEFGFSSTAWLDFFIVAGYIISIGATTLILGSMIYFHWKYRKGLDTNPTFIRYQTQIENIGR